MKRELNLWPNLTEADLGLLKTEGWFGAAIRWFEAWKSGQANASHAFGVACKTGVIIEAVMRVVARSISLYDRTPARIWRNRRWTPVERHAIVKQLASVVGEQYGWSKIPLFALDCLLPGQHYWFTRLFGVTHFKTCMNLYGWAVEKAIGQKVCGQPWRSLTPDLADDYCSLHPEEWELLFDSFPPPAKP